MHGSHEWEQDDDAIPGHCPWVPQLLLWLNLAKCTAWGWILHTPETHAMPSLLGISFCTNKEQSAGDSPGRIGSAGCSSSAVFSSPGVGILSSDPLSSAWPPCAEHCPFPCTSLNHCIFITEDAQHVHRKGSLHVERASTCLAPSSHHALPGEMTMPWKATVDGSSMWLSAV